MKNELTADEWRALTKALNYINETRLYEEQKEIIPAYERAVQKVRKVEKGLHA